MNQKVIDALCTSLMSFLPLYARLTTKGWRPTEEDRIVSMEAGNQGELQALIGDAVARGVISMGWRDPLLDAVHDWHDQPLCIRALLRQLLNELRLEQGVYQSRMVGTL